MGKGQGGCRRLRGLSRWGVNAWAISGLLWVAAAEAGWGQIQPLAAPNSGRPADVAQAVQTPAVADLVDVAPDHWAYGALQQLVARYQCLQGFPDGSFGGEQPLSRYEFAAALDACLTAVLASTDPDVEPDLELLGRLQEEFALELTTLEGQLDALEQTTAEVRSQQVSPTLKLYGEAIMALATGRGGNPPGRGSGNLIFGHSTQIGLGGTFTGRDLLRINLTAGSFADNAFASPDAFNTYTALLSFQSDTQNNVELDALEYRFAAFNDRAVFTVKPAGFSLSSVLFSNSPYDSSGVGAISRFASESPVFRIGALDSGVGVDWLLSDYERLQIAYGVRNPDNGSIEVTGSDHQALGVQLLLQPSDNSLVGLAYVNGYASDGRLDTFTGSFNADTSTGINGPAKIHAVNGTLQWQLGDITLGGWGGLMFTDAFNSDALALSSTFLGSIGWNDPFGREGDLWALMIGQPPRLMVGTSFREPRGSSLHIESFYRIALTQNIYLTPGFFWVTQPGNIANNNSIVVATLRTTFRF